MAHNNRLPSTYKWSVLGVHVTSSAVKDVQHVTRESVLLFSLGVHQVEQRDFFGGRGLNRLFEQVAQSFEFGATITTHELGEVSDPELGHVRELEERNAALVGLEGLFKVIVFLEPVRVVDRHLRRDQPQVDDLLVHGLGRHEGAEILFEVRVQGPQSRRLVHALGDRCVTRYGSIFRHNSRALNQFTCAVVVVATQFKFDVVSPHRCELFDLLVVDVERLFKYLARIVVLFVLFPEPRKAHPQRVQLAGGALRVDSGAAARVFFELALRIIVEQFDAFVPLLRVTWSAAITMYSLIRQVRT